MSNTVIDNVVDYISTIQLISKECAYSTLIKSSEDDELQFMQNIDTYKSIINEKYMNKLSIDAEDKQKYLKYINNYYKANNAEHLSKLTSLLDFDDEQAFLQNINKNIKTNYNINNFPQVIENHCEFFYRGLYRSSYLLGPSVFRDNNWQKEDYFYHEIMVRCPEKFQYSSHLDKLVMMQHYGCPTRLLDITSNPLVALYFACKDFGASKSSPSRQGTVYIFPVLKNDIAYADSDKALMLACLPKFSNKDKLQLYEQCNDRINEDNFIQIRGGSRYMNDVVEHFYHEITTEAPSFKREIKPIDLLRPLIVQPNKSNGRILKQDGAFILSGLSNNEREAYDKIGNISCKILTIRNQESILEELEQLGIHEASLFPEVDKVANYLRERSKVTTF